MGWFSWTCVLVLIGLAFKYIGEAVLEDIPRRFKEISNQLEDLTSRVNEIKSELNIDDKKSRYSKLEGIQSKLEEIEDYQQRLLWNKGTPYEYDHIPTVCFFSNCVFPQDKARWDGSKVSIKEWPMLTDLQKKRYFFEYYLHHNVKLQPKFADITEFSNYISKILSDSPDKNTPVINIIEDSLKEKS